MSIQRCTICSVLVLLVLSILTVTGAVGSAQAGARHDIDVNVGVLGGGSYAEDEADTWEEEGEITNTFAGLGYTFYFNEIREEEIPNELKVFLQHPARLSARISSSTYEEDTEREYESGTMADEDTRFETSVRDIRLSGSYYFPSNTGLGLALTLGSGEREYEMGSDGTVTYAHDADEDRRRISLWVDQYLNEKHRLRFYYSNYLREFSYEDENGRSWDRDRTTDWFEFSYTAAYGGSFRFYLDLDFAYGQAARDYETGRSDPSWDLYNFGLTFGPAFSRFAIYFYLDYTSWEPEDSDDTYDKYDLDYGLSPKVWFGDRVNLSFDLFGNLTYYDYPDAANTDGKTEATFGIEIALKVRF